jgi:heme-degrading monooxygenase HmoA
LAKFLTGHWLSLIQGIIAMYCASFIWEPGTYDAEFHRLNDLIDRVALSLPGYLGVESWQNADGTRRCANYYWTDLDSLRTFSTDPTHQEAKHNYAQWYKGYQIVISEVIRSYGDGQITHITDGAAA